MVVSFLDQGEDARGAAPLLARGGETVYTPSDWPARVSDVERMYILPRPIPQIYCLRSPGAANNLRGAAALYMSLRRCGRPVLDQLRARVLRLAAGHGPPDEDRHDTPDLLGQARLSKRLGAVFSDRIAGTTTLAPSALARRSATRRACQTRSGQPA